MTATVTITPDLSGFTAALEGIAKATRRMVTAFQATGLQVARLTEEGRQRQAMALVGLETRFYVRAALAPEYASQRGLDGLVHALLRTGELDAEVLAAGVLPTRENRVRLAVAAMEGWVGPDDGTRVAPPVCECWWTDPSTWLSAASLGYGSGYEPGSTMEWNPDCPVHRPTSVVR